MTRISKKKIQEEIEKFQQYHLKKLIPQSYLWGIRVENQNEVEGYNELNSFLNELKETWDRDTVMLKIAEYSHLPGLFNMVLSLGANVNVKDAEFNTPLHIAINNELKVPDEENLFLLINKIKKKDINNKNRYGETALLTGCKATKQPAINIFQKLLDSGANPNIANKREISPLHYACHHYNSHRKLDIVKILIDNGSDINAVTNEGLTVMSQAIMNDDIEKVNLLLKAGVKLKPNDHFYFVKNADILRILVSHGCDIQTKNKDGKTLFFKIAEEKWKNGFESILDCFLDLGVNINERDDEGETILFKLIYPVNTILISKLIEKGIDVNIQNKNGQTALYTLFNATFKVSERMELLEYLCRNTNINLNIKDNDGRTFLDGIITSDINVTRKIIEMGARPDLSSATLEKLKEKINNMPDTVMSESGGVIPSGYLSPGPNFEKRRAQYIYEYLKNLVNKNL